MLFAKKINKILFLPVLLVLLILSIESILSIIIEFFIISFRQINSDLFSYSNEFLHIVKMIIAKGISILVLVLLFNKKLRTYEIELQSDISSRSFLFIVILLYVGCISFLLENLSSSLLIISDTADIIKVWPEIVMSRIAIGYIEYQLSLILLLIIIIPVYEELLYRKATIQALIKKRFRLGWILIISSIIYSIPPFLLNLVEYSEEQAIWDFSIRIVSGLILAIVYLKTQKVRYPVLLKGLVNLIIYFRYLIKFNPIISQFKEYFNISIFIITSIGIILLFYIIFDGIATFWTTSSVPTWLNTLLDFQLYKDGQSRKIIYNLFFLLPLIPSGFILFIDHTILYSDFWGSLVKIGIKSVLLGIMIFVSGKQFFSDHSLFEAYPEPYISIKLIFNDYFYRIKKNYRIVIKESPQFIKHYFGFILFILGLISPMILIDMSATVFTSVPLLGRIIEVDIKMTSGQNPFLSYSRAEVSSRSPYFFMLPIHHTIDEMFYFFKHTNGHWYFLPDTFMSHPADWLHGLITVGTWFLLLILSYLVIREYRKNHETVAGVLVIALIAIEMLWYLFTLGLGSIPVEAEPVLPNTDLTFSQFMQMDFEMNWFVSIPLGLILLFLAASFFLVEGFLVYRQEKEKKRNEEEEKEEDIRRKRRRRRRKKRKEEDKERQRRRRRRRWGRRHRRRRLIKLSYLMGF
ncbi:MAG: type II CAAX prenyl endopeptidase Rce1 family protein [Promethearchaeota archaeon]